MENYTIGKIDFTTPARNMGQIVSVSYGLTARGSKICHIHDASDGSHVFQWDSGRRKGKKMTQKELEKYNLNAVVII